MTGSSVKETIMGFPMGTTVSYAESEERMQCGLRLIEKPTKHPRKVLDIQPQVVEASPMDKTRYSDEQLTQWVNEAGARMARNWRGLAKQLKKPLKITQKSVYTTLVPRT